MAAIRLTASAAVFWAGVAGPFLPAAFTISAYLRLAWALFQYWNKAHYPRSIFIREEANAVLFYIGFSKYYSNNHTRRTILRNLESFLSFHHSSPYSFLARTIFHSKPSTAYSLFPESPQRISELSEEKHVPKSF